MWKRTMILAALLALGGYLCVVQTSVAADQQAPTAAKADQKNISDNEFLIKAAKDNAMEVKLGEMAADRGASAGVRQYGQRLAKDHSKAEQQLMPIVREKGVNLPQEMSKKDRAAVDRFAALSGADFDRQFVQHMIHDHEKAIAMFENEAKNGKDAAAKAYAEKTLPTLREHLKIARELAGSTGGSAVPAGAGSTGGSAAPGGARSTGGSAVPGGR